MRHEIQSRFRGVENFIEKAGGREVPEDLQSYLFRLGTVLICGNIERSVEIIILDRLKSRAQPRVLNFVKSYFEHGQNFKCSNIQELLKRFDIKWHENFIDFLGKNQEVSDGVSSCYAVRNSVAHGGPMGVGKTRLKELYDASYKLINGVIEATE